jgi:hypothetical protein
MLAHTIIDICALELVDSLEPAPRREDATEGPARPSSAPSVPRQSYGRAQAQSVDWALGLVRWPARAVSWSWTNLFLGGMGMGKYRTSSALTVSMHRAHADTEPYSFL